MAVMEVGKVEMGMRGLYVFMQMDVSPRYGRRSMGMGMVTVIMAVPMDVLRFKVAVLMGVLLKNQEYDRNGQNQSRYDLNPRELFRKQ